MNIERPTSNFECRIGDADEVFIFFLTKEQISYLYK